MLSPILKKGRNRESTKAASSVRTGAFDLMNSFDNSKYKVSVLDIVQSSKKTEGEEFGNKAFGEPQV